MKKHFRNHFLFLVSEKINLGFTSPEELVFISGLIRLFLPELQWVELCCLWWSKLVVEKTQLFITLFHSWMKVKELLQIILQHLFFEPLPFWAAGGVRWFCLSVDSLRTHLLFCSCREAVSNFLTALNQQRRSQRCSHQQMSANIWAALRIAISMMDRPELFQAANIGDLDLLMRAFDVGDVWRWTRSPGWTEGGLKGFGSEDCLPETESGGLKPKRRRCEVLGNINSTTQ